MFWWKIKIIYKGNTELTNLYLFNQKCTGIQELDNNSAIAFFDSSIDIESLKFFLDKLDIEYQIDKQEQQNWLNKWKKNFKPVNIENTFLIYPPWEKPKENIKYKIIIEPNLAFGTGTHQTTQLMLRLMKELSFKEKTVLDIGTGSGILSFAAALLEANSVTSIEIDTTAIKYAHKNNTEFNKLNNIYFINGTIDCIKNKFDIILINIISSIQKGILQNIHRFLLEDSTIISSGILIEEDVEFTEFLISSGFKIIKKKTQDEWIAYHIEQEK